MSAAASGAAPTFLVGIDGSESSLAAARFTAALAEARGADVLLAAVRPGDEPPAATDGQLDRLHLPRARRAVHAASSVVRGLHELAEREAAAVVAVGAQHRYGIGRLKPGGVIERLLHGAERPVLVVGDERDGDAPVRTVGVAHAGDPDGEAALVAGTALARDLGAAVRVLRVEEPALAGEAPAQTPPAPVIPPAAELRTVEGHAAGELMREGDDLDLLVLGSRGYGPPGAVLLGSVSRRVVAHARCPVLVVPRAA